ncbi:MAG: hypothetical protein IIX24_05065 [Peptococcaceae bacterium]|nr:hypothetical protein [Peptococcaceae bacterium]
MRIIPKNTKVSTEFFKGVTLADMIVVFIGILIIFLIAISSLPYRGYIALGFGFVLVFLLVRIDEESNYMFFFRIIRHFSYYRSYRKPGFEYPESEVSEQIEESSYVSEVIGENQEEAIAEIEAKTGSEEMLISELDTTTPVISEDITGDMLILEKDETDDWYSEMKEDGFEILDLDELSMKAKIVARPADPYADMKKKVPKSVLKKIMKNLRK